MATLEGRLAKVELITLNSTVDMLQQGDIITLQEENVVLRGQVEVLMKKLAELEGRVDQCDAALATRGMVTQPFLTKDIPKPKPYKGTRSAQEIDNFLWGMQVYFNAAGYRGDASKLQAIPLYLEDIASLWWRKRCEDMKKGTCSINTWDEFKADLKKQFYLENAEDEARAMENEVQYMWLSTSREKYIDGGMDKEKQMERQELHDDLLNLILANLPFPGYIRFASVCSRWRQVQRNRLVRPPQSQHPILIQRAVEIAETYTIIGHSGVSREINLPGTYRKLVFASAHGWLLYGHTNNNEYFLLNPIMYLRIDLPAQLPQGAGWFSPVAISADPCTTEPENVIVMFMVDNAMVFCRAGDSEWSIIHTGEPYTVRGIWKSDMVACNGKVYALTETAKFGCVNFSSSCPEVDWLIQDDGFGLRERGKHCVCRFLVESLGDVLMVLAFRDSSFAVYKADLNGMRWIAVSDLGDQVLFLGRGSSLAASTAEAGKSGIHINFPVDYLKLAGMEMQAPTIFIPEKVSDWKYSIHHYHWHWILPSLLMPP